MSLAFEVKGIEEVSRDWIGAFPTRWKVVPGFAVLRERQVKNVGLAESRVLSLSYGRVIVKPEEKLRGLVPESFETYQIVEPGHIIIRPTDLQNDQVSLRVGQVHDRGIITSAYLCLEAHGGLKPDFAHLLLLAYDLKKVFYGLGSGLRQNLSWSDFKRLPIPVPPPDEQAQIVRFLRYLDQRVNRLIKAKRRLIELLNEQKQAIIHRAVTRGLDSTVPLKPSGDGDEQIPGHWERRAVMQLFSIGRGEVTSHEYIATHSGEYPLYSSQTSNEGIMGWIDTYMFDGEYLTWTTDGAHAGTVFHRQGKFNCTNVCGTLRSKSSNLHLPFMRYALGIETKSHVRIDINPKLMNNMMARIRVNVPPREEQIQIFDYLSSELEASDVVSKKALAEIDLIREYRTRLVADVVTGQLDVRHLNIPDWEVPSTEGLSDRFDEELEEEIAEEE